MSRIKNIIGEIENSVFGDPWHGSPVQKILGDITEEQANSRPVNNAHSIVELTLHMWAWTEEVMSRLKGNSPSDPEMGDWPNPNNYKNENWDAIRNKFYISTKNLLGVLKNFPEEKLDETIGGLREPSLGTGITFEAMLHGLAQHNAYHSGQIAILKKFLR